MVTSLSYLLTSAVYHPALNRKTPEPETRAERERGAVNTKGTARPRNREYPCLPPTLYNFSCFLLPNRTHLDDFPFFLFHVVRPPTHHAQRHFTRSHSRESSRPRGKITRPDQLYRAAGSCLTSPLCKSRRRRLPAHHRAVVGAAAGGYLVKAGVQEEEEVATDRSQALCLLSLLPLLSPLPNTPPPQSVLRFHSLNERWGRRGARGPKRVYAQLTKPGVIKRECASISAIGVCLKRRGG